LFRPQTSIVREKTEIDNFSTENRLAVGTVILDPYTQISLILTDIFLKY